MLLLAIIAIPTLIGFFMKNKLKATFVKYSRVPMAKGMSGFEVARQMLDDYGIYDVHITEGRGFLSDHYNPLKKEIKLSPQVFRGRHVAAAAVAAHECGHAVQHADGYGMLKFRSNLVPLIQISTRIQQVIFFIVMLGFGMSSTGGFMLQVLTATFGLTALMAFVTLPVEFDASNRALNWIEQTQTLNGNEYEGAKQSLWWAAMTYVVNAITSLILFLYFLLLIMGGRDRA